jgi:hypothetical protein
METIYQSWVFIQNEASVENYKQLTYKHLDSHSQPLKNQKTLNTASIKS